MQKLDIEQFNPKKAEIVALADKYKDLTIQGVDDKAGYLQVDLARKELKKTRVQIEKDGKMFRAEAVAFQKQVLELEKELVAIVEPLEVELAEKLAVIDIEKEKIKRLEVLPERREKLVSVGVEVLDEFILLMDDAQFAEFYVNKKDEFLEAQRLKQEAERIKAEEIAREAQLIAERKIKEERDAIEAEKRPFKKRNWRWKERNKSR
jgi:hypothetical protein